jgi:hypothetical protein
VIVIPMAGLSRRFLEAGYSLPKFMLPLHGRSVFAHAVASFRGSFADVPFLFIARGGEEVRDFVRAECAALGLADARVVLLQAATAGQAETVELGVKQAGAADGEPLTIFNIDTFRPGFAFPDFGRWGVSDGYLEVFRGSGANWSYVRPTPGEEPRVTETTEKVPISDLCCTGLYHFARAADFHASLAAERACPSAAELYVAPLYNHVLRRGGRIHYDVVDAAEVLFCGVPAEYEALREASPFAPGERPAAA